jgi:CRP/FNR family cyclic AMP-dependent transcriptional regulator
MAQPKPDSTATRILGEAGKPRVRRFCFSKLRPAAYGATSLRSHLPISNTTEYSEGQMIFGADSPSKSIYLVVTGTVEISKMTQGSRGVLLEIVRPDEVFGESAFLTDPCRLEQATALENATLMTWAVSDMEELVLKRPQLAVALLRVFTQRNAEISRRIESLSFETIERRLARSLIRFSERLGTPQGDGSVRMMPLTHEMLSRYVGASCEIISQYMRQFRKQGYLSYSGCGIVLYRDPLKKLLSQTARRPEVRRQAIL